MDRLRRSLRDSFRKKKEHVPEASKPHQWQADEAAVRAGTCSFHVKYLGCLEVFESRGMQVCEEALKMLRNSRRRPVKAILYVSGDGLRVVEDETKGLIVDQTIEKVSFCAPDRNHEKGFSYICRDGTTRRWMCHGFLALKESGERLSHAVGCAFAACLERKQRRDKECGVTMTFDAKHATFTRMGSFRQMSITERIADPQEVKLPINNISDTPQNKSANPFAIERPHATPLMLQRQGSFRGFSQLNNASPFKRQLSLRINELPSNLQRQRALSLGNPPPFQMPQMPVPVPIPETVQANGHPAGSILTNTANNQPPASPQPAPRSQRGRLMSLPNTIHMSPIAEASPVSDRADPVSALAQQVSQGLNLLTSSTDDFFLGATTQPASQPPFASTGAIANVGTTVSQPDLIPLSGPSSAPLALPTNWENWTPSTSTWTTSTTVPLATTATAVPPTAGLPQPDQWLGSVSNAAATATGSRSPRRTPHIAHLRSTSLGTAETLLGQASSTAHSDPFDAEWAALAARQSATNPFANAQPAFQVQM